MSGDTKRNRSKSFKKSKEIFSRADSVDAFNTADVIPNPDPIWKQVRTVWQNYQEILWDAHLTAVISSRKFRTLSKEWRIEQGEAPARVTKLVKEAFENFDVYRATEEILDSRLFGMQPMEPVWGKPRNFEGENKIFPVEFIGRPPYWFQYDNENKLRFRSKLNPHPGDEIPDYSLIVPRNNPKYDNPYGEALLSKVYWSVNFKKGGFKFWVEFSEKYGSPFVVAKAPRGAKDTETTELHDTVVEMTKGSAITIPDNAEIEIHNSSPKSNADVYKSLVDFCNAEISKAFLGQTLTTEQGDKGSRALGQVHDNVLDDFAEADEILAESCFNQLIRWIVDLNFGQNVKAPTFGYHHEQDIKGDVAERDQKLFEQNVRFTKEYYMKQYGFDEKDLELIEDPEKEEGGEFAEQKEPGSVQAVNHFLDSMSDEFLQKQAEFIKPIVKMIQTEKSYGEAEGKILELFDKVRPVILEKELGKAMTNSELLGRGASD